MAALSTKQKIIVSAIVVPVIIAIIVAVSVLSYFAYFPYKKGDVKKITSIALPEDGIVRVLQLTDLHLTDCRTVKQDKQTLRWVEQAIEFARPHIVAVTGDAVGGLGAFRGRDKSLIALAEIFEEKQVYWMYTFGNHDGEWSQATGKEVGKDNQYQGKEELYDLLKGYEYCLMQKGDTDGVGNYVIDVVDENGKTVYGFINMDSHDKAFDEDGNKKGYSGFTANQVVWYENQIKALQDRAGSADVKSSLFMHVPLYEYTDAWLNYEHVGGFEPVYTEKKVYSAESDIGFYDKMVELGSTDFVSVGHDHDFNFVKDYNGIYLSYGRVSGVNAWSRRTSVGATVVDINVNADEIQNRYHTFNIYPTFDYLEWSGWTENWN